MELLDIFDEKMLKIGTAERKEVHKRGLWHHTFHCWFVKVIDNDKYVFVQKRQKGKDTFPETFDVTAAGHLLSNETPEDGIREVKEELGINVEFSQLIPMGIVANEIITADYTDREFCHTFIYLSDNDFTDFSLQEEEVSGIYLVKVNDLKELIMGKKKSIEATGMEETNGQSQPVTTMLTSEDFVPHHRNYYEAVFSNMMNLNILMK
ncbi:NUDIX hydrolase [Brevibacillus sp. SYSU BS000544]|uniref:NUDIX hydrolase n=1 Tax=Brevibacillus sp. SYSU BS000544 TaxID=3416443 RepID=UPI003CE5A485